MDISEVGGSLEQSISSYLDQILGSGLNIVWNDNSAEANAKIIADAVVSFAYQYRNDYKYFVTCIISKKNQVDPKVYSSAQCDADKDFCLSICKDNSSLYCVLNLFASYIGS